MTEEIQERNQKCNQHTHSRSNTVPPIYNYYQHTDPKAPSVHSIHWYRTWVTWLLIDNSKVAVNIYIYIYIYGFVVCVVTVQKLQGQLKCVVVIFFCNILQPVTFTTTRLNVNCTFEETTHTHTHKHTNTHTHALPYLYTISTISNAHCDPQ
jgi:hypothetical protein